jgi:hypothetical protein
VAIAPAFKPADWLAVREACLVLFKHLSPPETTSGPIADTQSAPKLGLLAANTAGAGTVVIPAAPLSAPLSSLLSLELPQSSWGLGLGLQTVAQEMDTPRADTTTPAMV